MFSYGSRIRCNSKMCSLFVHVFINPPPLRELVQMPKKGLRSFSYLCPYFPNMSPFSYFSWNWSKFSKIDPLWLHVFIPPQKLVKMLKKDYPWLHVFVTPELIKNLKKESHMGHRIRPSPETVQHFPRIRWAS